MAKKKKEETPAPGSPAWMATFSDLMNLLLCFFVLLFAMSSVDEGKAEALIQSLAQTFSIFEGGGASFGEGNMISNGASQLSNLDDYFSTMGQTDDGQIDQNVNEDPNGSGSENDVGADSSIAVPSPSPTLTPEQTILAENKGQSLTVYDEVADLTNKYNLGDYVEIGIDADEYKYITIEVRGAVLFESGKAELKSEALPIISRIGDILKQYPGYQIEVIGHTDNVPLTKAPYYSNEMLSSARAISVATYLAGVDGKNLGWENVYFSGRGSHDPVASNETEEGRARNRRVEIRLYNAKNSKN